MAPSKCVLAATFPVQTAFSATNTNFAQQNTVDVNITGCVGYAVKFSSCNTDGGSAAGSNRNNYRLYNAAGTAVAVGGQGINNQYCNADLWGAYITYVFAGTAGSCQTHTFKQGCHEGYACSGFVNILVTGY